jgi:hypothetical protein
MTEIKLVEMKEHAGIKCAVLEVHYGQGEAHLTIPLPVPLFQGEPRGEVINRGIGHLIDGLDDWEESKKEIV